MITVDPAQIGLVAQRHTATQVIPQLLKFITKVAMTNHTSTCPCGAIGTTTTQHVVFGMSMVGMKNGASGVMTSAGNTMEHGRWDTDLK
jgi:hypothetical protein